MIAKRQSAPDSVKFVLMEAICVFVRVLCVPLYHTETLIPLLKQIHLCLHLTARLTWGDGAPATVRQS